MKDEIFPVAAILMAAAFVVWLLLQLVIVGMYPLLRKALMRCAVEVQISFLQRLFLAPVLISSVAVGFVLIPAALPSVFSSHCHSSSGCAIHIPVSIPDLLTALFALFAAFVVCSSVVLIRLGWIASRMQNVVRGLEARIDPQGFLRVSTETPLALSIGTWRPQVILSTGLLNRVSDDQLALVLAHENCHRTNRDGLRTALNMVLCPLTLRAAPGRDMARALELRADGAARQVAGSGAVVAETLLLLHRVLPQVRSFAILGFGGVELRDRVVALLSPSDESTAEVQWKRRCWTALWVTGQLAVAGICVSPLHHLMEIFA